MPGTRKLNLPTNQRKALLRNLVTSFLENGRIETETELTLNYVTNPQKPNKTAITIINLLSVVRLFGMRNFNKKPHPAPINIEEKLYTSGNTISNALIVVEDADVTKVIAME